MFVIRKKIQTFLARSEQTQSELSKKIKLLFIVNFFHFSYFFLSARRLDGDECMPGLHCFTSAYSVSDCLCGLFSLVTVLVDALLSGSRRLDLYGKRE